MPIFTCFYEFVARHTEPERPTTYLRMIMQLLPTHVIVNLNEFRATRKSYGIFVRNGTRGWTTPILQAETLARSSSGPPLLPVGAGAPRRYLCFTCGTRVWNAPARDASLIDEGLNLTKFRHWVTRWSAKVARDRMWKFGRVQGDEQHIRVRYPVQGLPGAGAPSDQGSLASGPAWLSLGLEQTPPACSAVRDR